MKKLTISCFTCLMCCHIALAQVGIGTNSPKPSAALDVRSTDHGLLIPSMTTIERNGISSPAEGLLVYDITAHRLYQYQDGIWRHHITNDYWAQSTTRKWVYNGSDSIGIGTAAPQEKLHVSNGNVLVTGEVHISNAAGIGVLSPEQQLHVRSATSSEGILLDAVNPILQLRQSNTPNPGYANKGFLQLSGDNLRIGTNSGNTDGKFVIRNNGADRLSVDAAGNVEVTGDVTTATTGTKSLLPICYGRVGFSAITVNGTANFSVTRTSTGVYEVYCPQFTSTNTILVTMNGYAGGSYNPVLCEYIAVGHYRVTFYNTSYPPNSDAAFSVVAYE